MFSTAMVTKPSATSSGVMALPVAAGSLGQAFERSARHVSASSGWSAFGPNTLGKNSGRSLPSMTLQSVTVSGPPRR
jgi:hypothetical protein